MKTKYFIPVLICLLFFSCKSKPEPVIDFKEAPLFGMVYGTDNNPLSGVLIRIETASGNGTVSDIDGRFVISSLTKGTHTIFSSLDNYEDLHFRFEFLNRTRVMYLKMTSFDSLLKSAENSIDTKKFEEAENLLNRAAVLNDANPLLLYLRAVLFFKTDQIKQAEEILISLINSGYSKAYVYLFLADLNQYFLNKPDKAIEYLSEYLKIEHNPDAEERVLKLTKNIKE